MWHIVVHALWNDKQNCTYVYRNYYVSRQRTAYFRATVQNVPCRDTFLLEQNFFKCGAFSNIASGDKSGVSLKMEPAVYFMNGWAYCWYKGFKATYCELMRMNCTYTDSTILSVSGELPSLAVDVVTKPAAWMWVATNNRCHYWTLSVTSRNHRNSERGKCLL